MHKLKCILCMFSKMHKLKCIFWIWIQAKYLYFMLYENMFSGIYITFCTFLYYLTSRTLASFPLGEFETTNMAVLVPDCENSGTECVLSWFSTLFEVCQRSVVTLTCWVNRQNLRNVLNGFCVPKHNVLWEQRRLIKYSVRKRHRGMVIAAQLWLK